MLGGVVLTMDSRLSRADAVAVRDGKFEAVGASAEIARMAGPETDVLHLAGRALVPGFIDSHNHFSMTVFEPVTVNCRMPPLDSKQAVLDTINAAGQGSPPGRWIMGLGYRSSYFGDQGKPTRWELDEAAGDRPVCIMDASYHACYANSAALELAGIDRDTPDPRMGWIRKNASGEPDGTLWERAMDLVHQPTIRSFVDRYSEDEIAELVRRHAQKHLSHGVTSVGDALVMPESAELYRIADAKSKLPIMVHQMRGGERFFAPPERASRGDFDGDNVSDRLRGGVMKIFMDPVFHGPDASVRHVDHGNEPGDIYYSQEEANRLVLAASERGIQVAIYCIGGRAIDQSLNAFEGAIKKHPSTSDLRPRLEHTTYASTEQIERAASMGVILSYQPAFLYSAGERLHKRTPPGRTLMPFKTMLDEGVVLAAGSDYPCAPLEPILGLHSMVGRTDRDSGREIAPQEAVSPMDALAAYTRGSAFAVHRDAEVGSLEVGKRADMVVLSHDPTAVEPDYIRDISVHSRPMLTAAFCIKRRAAACKPPSIVGEE